MPTKDTTRYSEGIGRRKTSIARVRLTPHGKKSISVNGKDLISFFPVKENQVTILDPFKIAGKTPETPAFSVSIKVAGGGVSSQAGAIRHGIARALEKYNPILRKDLKKAGFLKRDPRQVERKKFGLKKARKAPQWSKR
ncbi:MAG: 30S ribosomal protein S9 [bacterium]|nr:30S ribosomal protein S9 [bacterium]